MLVDLTGEQVLDRGVLDRLEPLLDWCRLVLARLALSSAPKEHEHVAVVYDCAAVGSALVEVWNLKVVELQGPGILLYLFMLLFVFLLSMQRTFGILLRLESIILIVRAPGQIGAAYHEDVALLVEAGGGVQLDLRRREGQQIWLELVSLWNVAAHARNPRQCVDNYHLLPLDPLLFLLWHRLVGDFVCGDLAKLAKEIAVRVRSWDACHWLDILPVIGNLKYEDGERIFESICRLPSPRSSACLYLRAEDLKGRALMATAVEEISDLHCLELCYFISLKVEHALLRLLYGEAWRDWSLGLLGSSDLVLLLLLRIRDQLLLAHRYYLSIRLVYLSEGACKI